ncbi:MAG TPA: DNA-binding protein [Flavobacterium sp.]|nr:DNA-binding protein [Flavobacterium sp.]
MSEIEIYNGSNNEVQVEVQFEEETVWLTQAQMALLFDRNRVAITQHIGNIFKEGELEEKVVCKDFLQASQHGAIKGKTQISKVKYYNLDVIISVGYRVKSKRGTQFRIWATQRLKDYLLKGYAINNRMNRLEDKFDKLDNKVNQIDLQINTNLIPTQGVFFDGQVFDAYELASKIIRSAKQKIVLIDNYIDENTFTHLAKKSKGVNVEILTKAHSKHLTLDLQKANEQYGDFILRTFTQSHDRFLIIDQKEVYHLGASLKDLGKKWFAFSKLNIETVKGIVNEIKEI